MLARLLLLAAVLLLTAQAPAPAPSDELRALKKKAHELAIRRPAEALEAAQRALELAERLFGPDHVEVAEVLAELARVHAVKDQFADAEPLEQRAIAIMEKGLGAEHRELAKFLARIAQPHIRKRFAYAKPLYKRALDIGEKAAASAIKWPVTIFYVGYSYETAHNHADALPLFEWALAEAEKAFGADSLWTLILLDRLPYSYLRAGRYVDAEQTLRRSLSTFGRLYGSDQHNPIGSYHLRRLAGLYAEQGYYADAERLLRRGHDIAEKPDQASHPAWVAFRASQLGELDRELAGLHHAQGRYAEAEAFYSRELAKLEAAAADTATKAAIAAQEDKLRAMGKVRSWEDSVARRPLHEELVRLQARLPRKTEIASILGSLGSVRWKQGKHAEAEALFDRALALLGESDDATAISLMISLARLYADQGRYADAEQLYTRLLQLDEEDRRGLDEDRWGKRRRPADLTTASILNHLGQLSRKRKRLEGAEQLHKRALAILEELGPDRIDVGTTLNDLAEVHRDQGKFAEAERLYKRVLEICEKGNLSPGHALVRTALANLAALYEGHGRSADADRLKRGGPHAELWIR